MEDLNGEQYWTQTSAHFLREAWRVSSCPNSQAAPYSDGPKKWPSGMIAPFYAEAVEAVAGFIRRGATKPSMIERTIDRLFQAEAVTEWQQRRNLGCIDALKAFMEMAHELDLSKYRLKQAGNFSKKLTISGVHVSVRPELTLVTERNNSRTAGAIKLYFSKQHALGEKSAQYVGSLLHNFTAQYVAPEGTAHRSDCLVLDVFGKRIYRAPRPTKTRDKEIAAGCKEIAALWDGLEPPRSARKLAGNRASGETAQT